jgi:predicted nucleic acid-binding protein
VKTVLCDINIILDIFLKREPFYTPTARLFFMIEEKKVHGYLCALGFPTVFYIVAKQLKRQKTMQVLEKLRIVFDVAAVDQEVVDLALVSGFKDFEDAVQYYSAIHVHADCLITRDKADYRVDPLPILTPEEFLASSTEEVSE